jgi:hypothetical protein
MSNGLSCYASYFKQVFTGPFSNWLSPQFAPVGCADTFRFLNSLFKDFFVILVTTGVFALFAYIYLDKLQPVIYVKRLKKLNPCPDLWTFDGENCNPTYTTQCNPFNPKNYEGHECEIAKSCGTGWKGFCK